MESIKKIGGIILDSKKILVVRKRIPDNRSEYIIPGGKIEPNESDEECLKRELKEELNTDVISSNYFNTFEDIVLFENIPIIMKVYFIKIKGEISPKSEIKEYIWVDKKYADNNIKLGSILSKFIIPYLIKADLM